MEQYLSFEILDALLAEESHARALAKKLGINHMTILRKLRELVEENVIDSKMKGRNKVYFLKRVVEARNYTIMAEVYKMNKIMKKYPDLRSIIENIQKNEKIGLAILFGSYAKGTARKESDIDVFVETKDRRLKKGLELLNSKLSVKIGDYDRLSLLIKEIEKNHAVLKGVELYYEKNKFFY